MSSRTSSSLTTSTCQDAHHLCLTGDGTELRNVWDLTLIPWVQRVGVMAGSSARPALASPDSMSVVTVAKGDQEQGRFPSESSEN